MATNLLVNHRTERSITERIRSVLRNRLAEQLPSLEEVAAELAMSPRILRGRLQLEGSSYSAIKSRLRLDTAIELLARPDVALEAIAESIGFSDAGTFHRAFKRSTGVAPGQYRRNLLCEPRSGGVRDTRTEGM